MIFTVRNHRYVQKAQLISHYLVVSFGACVDCLFITLTLFFSPQESSNLYGSVFILKFAFVLDIG